MSNQVYCKRCGHVCVESLEQGAKRYHCEQCGFIYYKNPFPCISVLIVDEQNRVLLGLRGKDSIYANQWCLPCGYIEYEETYVAAAHRETKEETGIEIEVEGIINVVSNQFDNGVNSLVITVLAKPKTMDAVAGDDIVEAKWFSLEDTLPSMAFDADTYIIQKYKDTKEEQRQVASLDLAGTFFSA